MHNRNLKQNLLSKNKFQTYDNYIILNTKRNTGDNVLDLLQWDIHVVITVHFITYTVYKIVYFTCVMLMKIILFDLYLLVFSIMHHCY